MEEELVVVTRVPSIHAALVAGALEAEGLTVVLDRPGFGPIYGLDTGPYATAVKVPASQADAARALLAQVEGGAEAP